jgi:hypothetical protein
MTETALLLAVSPNGTIVFEPDPNGTKKSPKACVASFLVFRLGMYSHRLCLCGQDTGGSASEDRLRASRLLTSQGKGYILT